MKIWYQSRWTSPNTLITQKHWQHTSEKLPVHGPGPSPWPSWRSSESSTRLRDHRPHSSSIRALSIRPLFELYWRQRRRTQTPYRCFLQRAHSSRATWFGKDPSGLNVGGLLRRGDNEEFKCFSTSEECACSRNSTVPMQSFQGTPRSEIYNLAF